MGKAAAAAAALALSVAAAAAAAASGKSCLSREGREIYNAPAAAAAALSSYLALL